MVNWALNVQTELVEYVESFDCMQLIIINPKYSACSFAFCTKDETQHLRRLSKIHYYHRVIGNSSLRH